MAAFGLFLSLWLPVSVLLKRNSNHHRMFVYLFRIVNIRAKATFFLPLAINPLSQRDPLPRLNSSIVNLPLKNQSLDF